MKRTLSVGLLVVALAGCQPAVPPAAAPTEQMPAAAASASIWGEVPKHCT